MESKWKVPLVSTMHGDVSIPLLLHIPQFIVSFTKKNSIEPWLIICAYLYQDRRRYSLKHLSILKNAQVIKLLSATD